MKQVIGIIRKPVLSKLLITVIWLAFLSLFRLAFDWSVLFLWLGGIVGTFLIEADQLVYVYTQRPEDPVSVEVRGLIGQKKWAEAATLILSTAKDRRQLVFHSVIFQVLFQIFSFFVITSTGSYFGIGLVLAMSLHLLVKEMKDPDMFFWQIKADINRENRKTYLVCISLFFIFLNYLVIRF